MALALSLVGLTGCASTTQIGATGVDRRQFMLVSSDEINAASSQQYQQVIAQARQKVYWIPMLRRSNVCEISLID